MKGWKDERRRVYGKYVSLNISLSTTGWKDERMKEWKEMSIGKYLSINIYLSTSGWKNERMKGEEYMESI